MTRRRQQLPNRLRAWRAERDLSLADVADLVGLTEGALSRIERGERGAAPLTRVRIARRLGARVADLWDVEPVEGQRVG